MRHRPTPHRGGAVPQLGVVGAEVPRRGRHAAAAPPAVAPNVTPRSPLAGVDWNFTLGGFLLYLLVITSYRLPVGDVAIAMALGGILLQRGKVRFPPYLVWLTVCAVWVFVASTRSEYPEWVSPQLTAMVKLVLIVFVAANALRTRPQVRLFMVFFLGCFALFPLRGAMFNFFLYGNDVQGRAVWNLLYSNPNDLGAMALLQLSMAVALLASEPKGWVRWSAIAGVFMVPMLILMTQSRGVFLGLVAFIGIVIAGQRRRVQMILRLVVLAIALAAVAPAGVWERLGTLQNATSTATLNQVDGEGGSARQRSEIWKVAFKMIGDHPLTGVGIGAYKPNHERYADDPEFNPTAQGKRDTHSLYFNVLAETGYPGLLLYVGMLVTVFITAETTRRRCRGVMDAAARQLLLLEAGLIGFLVASIFGSLPYLPHFMLHIVLLYALSILYRQELAAGGMQLPGQTQGHAPARRSALVHRTANAAAVPAPFAPGRRKRGLA
jgi:probable O-glycosylation ligase (exosortase A-associated)